jgi:ATP/maltotriose-dependent transcriptional regulator MalT
MEVHVRALTPPAESIEAVEANVSSGDFARALDLIRSDWPGLAGTQGARLRAAIRQVPESLWNEDAWIIAALGASFRSVESPGTAAALPHFELAELLIAAGASSASRLPAIQLHHAAALRRLGRMDAARKKAESAWAMVHSGVEQALPLRLALQATAALHLGLLDLHAGNITAAVTRLRLALDLSENGIPETDITECLGGLAFAAYALGDFEQAEQLIERANAIAVDTRVLHSPFGAPALAARMLIAVDRNQSAAARMDAAVLAAAARRSDWEPLAYYARSAADAINGQLIEALDLQRRCVTAARDWEGSPGIRALAQLLRAGLHQHLGEPQRAIEILSTIEPLPDHASCPAGLLASIRFGEGDYVGCLDALAGCAAIGDSHSSRSLTDVLLLTAAASYELGNFAAADVAFDRALYLGGQTGIRVPFHAIPRIPMLRMLNRAADRYQPEAVHHLLGELRVGSAASAELVEPLSDRELDIAQHLFQDKTVSQIAADLFISANTVKTHVRSIYRKLSATSRKDAIRRVHELGLDVRITPF